MESWVRYSVAVYVGLLLAGVMMGRPMVPDTATAGTACAHVTCHVCEHVDAQKKKVQSVSPLRHSRAGENSSLRQTPMDNRGFPPARE